MNVRLLKWLVAVVIALGCSLPCLADQPVVDWEQRLKEVEAKQKVAPNDFDLKVEHAQVLGKLGRYSEQLKEGNELLALRPKSVDLLYMVEATSACLRKYEDALKYNGRIIDLGNPDMHVYSRRALLLFLTSDYSGAIKCADKSIAEGASESEPSHDLLIAHAIRATAKYHMSGANEKILAELEHANEVLRLQSFAVEIRRMQADLESHTRSVH